MCGSWVVVGGNIFPGKVLWSHPERQQSQTVSQMRVTSMQYLCLPRKDTVRADVLFPGKVLWSHPERQQSQTKSLLLLTSRSVPACTLCTSTHAVYILFRLAKDPGLRQGSALTCAALLTRHLELGSAPPAATLKLSRHCQPVG